MNHEEWKAEERANMHFAAGDLAGSQGQEEEMRRHYDAGFAIAREHGLIVEPRLWSTAEEEVLGDPEIWFD